MFRRSSFFAVINPYLALFMFSLSYNSFILLLPITNAEELPATSGTAFVRALTSSPSVKTTSDVPAKDTFSVGVVGLRSRFDPDRLNFPSRVFLERKFRIERAGNPSGAVALDRSVSSSSFATFGVLLPDGSDPIVLLLLFGRLSLSTFCELHSVAVASFC
uniref:Putative secreted protein n=1 Tax=Anopheles darlingi TaxID=43151 RepID=A0A2M4DDT7_ANODA